MNPQLVDVVVIGAGHAGLSVSYYLKTHRLNHVVLERGRVGESWRSQRWDNFMINSPNKYNLLPGLGESNPDGFGSAHALAESMSEYVRVHQLPVIEHAHVLSVEQQPDEEWFIVTIARNGQHDHYRSRQVIVASGSMNEQKIPAFAGRLSPDVRQYHVSDYRRPDQLPDGGVLVVGGGQSGCQVAEDLAEAGRSVYLATSPVARLPRRYRGKDVMEWMMQMNFFDMRAEDVADPVMLHLRTPLLTGRDGGQRTLSLQSLARKGVTILGKMTEVDGKIASFAPNASMHVRFADEFSRQIKEMIDGYIAASNLSAPAPQYDPDDQPDFNADCASSLTELNLDEQHITSIIWATGFGADFSYIRLPVFDGSGNPVHRNGIAAVNGVYFMGLHWMRNRKSTILYGIKDDARFIADAVLTAHRQTLSATV